MNKTELLATLDKVIADIDNAMNTTDKAFDYVKLDVRKRTFVEVKDFIANELDDVKATKKGE